MPDGTTGSGGEDGTRRSRPGPTGPAGTRTPTRTVRSTGRPPRGRRPPSGGARDVPRPGGRKGPRPARDISGAAAVGGRNETDDGQASRDSKGRKRGRPRKDPAPADRARTAAVPGCRPISQIVEVMFKGVRAEYYSFRRDHPLRPDEYVIVQADRGQDIGWVKRAVDATRTPATGAVITPTTSTGIP